MNDFDGAQGDWKALGQTHGPRVHREYSKSHFYSSKTDLAHVHVLFMYYSKKTLFKLVPAWHRVIKMLLDTFSDLDKPNHREYGKYPVMLIKITMAQVCILLCRDKSIKTVSGRSRWYLNTLSDLVKLNHGDSLYFQHVSWTIYHFWPRITYLSCTWMLAFRAS